MALSNWNPYTNNNDEMRMHRGETTQSFRRLQGQMNRLFENFFGNNGIQPQGQSWSGLAIPSENNVNSMANRQASNFNNRTATNFNNPTATNYPSQTSNVPSGTPTRMPSTSSRQFSSRPPFDKWQFQFTPCVEVTEDAETIHVMAELPGIDKDNLELFCNDNTLTITGEKNFQSMEEGNGNFLQSERSYGFFRRSIPFNVSVDTDGAEATYEDGVLHVQLPKTGASKGTQLNID